MHSVLFELSLKLFFKKMETLKGPKSVLIGTFLYKKSAYKIWIVEIPYVILNLFFLLPLLSIFLLLYYTIYVDLMKNDAGFKDISDTMYIIFGSSSAFCIYSSFAQSSNEIITLMDLIELVVANRKCCFVLHSLRSLDHPALSHRSKTLEHLEANLHWSWHFERQFCSKV